MDFGNEVKAAVADLEETLRLSRRLDVGFDDRRKEAIEQRRDISEKLARLSSAAQAIPDIHARSTFLSALSKMRAALAVHQASWPIVTIDQTNPTYLASIKAARSAYEQFFDWVRAQSR